MSAPVASAPSAPARPAGRLLLFALAAIAAFYLGFVHFPVAAALTILREAGYYVILLTFVLWVVAVWRLYRARERPPPGAGPPCSTSRR